LPEDAFSKNHYLALAMSRSMSVKSGETLNKEAMEHMINQLFSCEEPTMTPSGKKVFVKITGDNLNSKFN
jgi:DNA mismatch repair protein MutL